MKANHFAQLSTKMNRTLFLTLVLAISIPVLAIGELCIPCTTATDTINCGSCSQGTAVRYHYAPENYTTCFGFPSSQYKCLENSYLTDVVFYLEKPRAFDTGTCPLCDWYVDTITSYSVHECYTEVESLCGGNG